MPSITIKNRYNALIELRNAIDETTRTFDYEDDHEFRQELWNVKARINEKAVQIAEKIKNQILEEQLQNQFVQFVREI